MKGKLIQNKYFILQVLHQDVFSETFLAKDKNWFSRHRYVIKRFRPILGNPKAEATRQLFYQEASILKRLSGNNPQIPQLCEYFIDGEDFYIVRKWIDGLTLKQKVQQQGKLPAAEVEQILASILSFLNYIHSYGIVYRQLKPSSIVLRRSHWLNRAKKELPVPIYFGGVKEAEAEKINHRGLVIAHQQEYNSPEQEQGRSVYASDLYSLGLTAIYLLTGKTPAQLPLDPQTKQLLWHQEVKDLKIHLVRVIDRAICPRVSDRYSSATQMLRALHSPPVSISETIVEHSGKRLFLTSEVKVIFSLLLLGSAVLGVAFLFLNRDELKAPLRDRISWFEKGSSKVLQTEALTTADKLEREELQLEADKSPLSSAETDDNIAPTLNSTSSCYSKESCSAIEVIFVPAFGVGTSQQQIIDSLGEPDRTSKGYWENSYAFLYRFIPSKINLGYLLDVETNLVRQTEVSFAKSVDLLTIHQAAQRLLADNYSADLEDRLNQIYLNNSDRYQFEVDNLEGTIERDPKDRIYLGIWDRTFH